MLCLKRFNVELLRFNGWPAAVLGVILGCTAHFAWADQEGVPALDHVWLVVMENQSPHDIIGSRLAPFLNSMAATHAQAGNYFAITHPSLPNYLAMISGQFNDNTGVPIATDGSPHWGSLANTSSLYGALRVKTLADQLHAAGKTWKSYQESLPDTGAYGVDEILNAANGPLYAVKHNPFAYFSSIQGDAVRMADIVSFNQLHADLSQEGVPNFSFVVPDICHDMHGGPGCSDVNDLIRAGDEEVRRLYQSITAASVWKKGRNAIIVVWDEDDYSGNNRVPLIVATNYQTAGGIDNAVYSHYSLLRTLEDAFGLGRAYLGGAAQASPMVRLFAPGR